MKSLFIGSVTEYSGKNLVVLGIAHRCKDMGKKTGYFKPFGHSPVDNQNIASDDDAVFFKKVLGLHDPLSDICPVTLTSQAMNEMYGGGQFDAKARIQKAFAKVSGDKEVMLVSGFGGMSGGCCSGYSQLDAIRDLGCRAVIVEKYATDERDLIDRVMWVRRLAGDGLMGVVLNMIPEFKLELFRTKVVPFLKAKGIETFGLIPEDPVLHSVPVKEVAEQLCGQVICCEDELENLVERAIVGAMNVDSALKYFRKINNKAVVTGGDRGDIQLAAMETSTRCLILTGDLYPHQNIVTVAVEKKVPIIVVPYDTLTTIDKFESVLGHCGLRDEKKIDRALGVVSNCIDFRPIEAYINK